MAVWVLYIGQSLEPWEYMIANAGHANRHIIFDIIDQSMPVLF